MRILATRGPRCRSRAAAAALLVLAGCGGSSTTFADPPASATPAGRAAAPPALCGPVRTTVTGRVGAADLTELSGLAQGRGGGLWAIEDSGAPPVLVGLRPDGTVTTRATVTGAGNVDWEDVGAVRGEVVVADIGDNDRVRGSVQLYRVPEPATGATATAPATRLDLRYPDGPHDAEALLVDPLRDRVVVVTKALTGARAYITRRSGPAGTRTLRRGPGVALALITGGSVSADGRVVALRTYTGLALWRRRGREPLTRTLARRPCIARPLLAKEGQGEAVALDRHGRAARTVPEGARGKLRRYAAR